MSPDLTPAFLSRLLDWPRQTESSAALGKWGQGTGGSLVVGKEQVFPLHFLQLLILGSQGPTSSGLPARVSPRPSLKPS